MQLIPVDHDPFAASPQSGGSTPKFVPVDHDPFVMPDKGTLNASTRGIGDTLSFGLMNNAVAAGAATLEPALDWMTGRNNDQTWEQRYESALADERATDAAAQAQHPIASTAGKVAGIAVAAPKAVAGAVAPIMRSATLGERAVNAGIGAAKGAAGGAVYGGLSGFGHGQGGFENRLESAGEGALTGAEAGAVLGGALGGLSRVPAAPPPPNAVASAADRAGVYMPMGVASDNPAIQQASGAAKSMPYFGTRITEAGKQTAADFAAAKNRVAEGFGGGIAATPFSAGKEARDALENWIGPLTKGVLKNQYDAVDALVNPNVTTPLNATAKVATDITRRNAAATLPPGGAVNFVRNAVTSPQGLTYQGIKDLRTHVGDMLEDQSYLSAGFKERELRQIYGGLTDDLRAATLKAGGSAAQKAFDKSNALNAAVERRREELARLLGTPKNPTAPEQIFAAIQRKAGSKSTADIATLNKIRKSMPPDAWDKIASGVVGELGRSDALGTVSLDRFFTGYNQLSPAGKQALFGNQPHLSDLLDDLSTLAGRGKEVAKWANPSGTAQHGAYLATGAAIASPMLWPKIALGALGGHLLTRALTRPATVRAMTGWARMWNQINRSGFGGPSQQLGKSLQFVSRRFASEIGMQFGLGPAEVNRLTVQLQHPPSSLGPQPAAADQQNNEMGRPQ